MNIPGRFALLLSLAIPAVGAENAEVPVELLYRDGRSVQTELTGWGPEGPQLQWEDIGKGLVGLRLPEPEKNVLHRGVGPEAEWRLPRGAAMEDGKEPGWLFRFRKGQSNKTQRTLPELTGRFHIRLRFRRETIRDVQFHFFAPENGYRARGMLGVGVGASVTLYLHRKERHLSPRQSYPAPEWKNGCNEIEVVGDPKQNLLGVRVNRGNWVVWEVLEEDFPALTGRVLRFQPLNPEGTLRILQLDILKWNGVVHKNTEGPFPLWHLRNGDRIPGQVAEWDGNSVGLKVTEDVTVPLPVSRVDTVWFADPASNP